MTFDNGHALVIAVAEYPEQADVLPGAVVNDARDIATVLQDPGYCGFRPHRVRMLVNHQATLDTIRTELSELASSASPDDTVVVFFSGHGARFGTGLTETSSLMPFDYRAEDLPGTTLQAAEFSETLASIRARRLLVLLDACHSGGAGTLKESQSAQARPGFDEKSLQKLAQGVGRVIIASSRASEVSFVLPGARNSVFTDNLLQALKGRAQTKGDGLIRVFDIFNYVAEHVHRAKPEQHPTFKASDLEDNFPVALDLGGKKTPAHMTPTWPDQWRALEEIMADLYPTGPTDQDIWARAGGDISRLTLTGTGRAAWFAALRVLRLGGGGHEINIHTLLEAALSDFPDHAGLTALAPSL
ncbi:caspase family protein [Actinomadura sp. 7K534]|uniref:caspase family protein n=1 Tax=Actinomadura sp. 7K534 TaxID=2530366 RepID=UPI00104E6289|nr:caspase family protein [Actinomadura sp. 7K534]TDB89801.1 caspase family protein [Actinomadura sp. 7K534]